MKRRNLLAGLVAAGVVTKSSLAWGQTIDLWGLITGRPPGSQNLSIEINGLQLQVQLAMMVGNRAEAKRLALQLVPLSQIDTRWYTYTSSFLITKTLVELTDPSDRTAWVFANRGLLECFPGVGGGIHRDNYRALAKAAHDLLIADAAGPPLVSRDVRGTAAALGLFLSALAPGPERGRWAQVCRQEALRNPDAAEAIRAWSKDAITPRFIAVGIALSGDWKAAASNYDAILPNAVGTMPRLLREQPRSTIAGLMAVVAGATTVEAEGATIYAMSGRLPLAVDLLEKSRRNTGRARLEAAQAGGVARTGQQQELQLVSAGVTIVQVVTSLVGTFALVSALRKGKLQRFTAFNPDPGGVELLGRMVDSRSDHFMKDGLAPVYQRTRRDRGKSAEGKFKAYVARAASDAEALVGSTLRTALSRASVTPKDDVLVVLPANLALLPISLSHGSEASEPLGMQYRIRYADSLAAAQSASATSRLVRAQTLAALEPNPTIANLDYLAFERACVASCFPDQVRVVPASDAPSALAGLDESSHWHIASHASWNFKDPDKSGIVIGSKTTVTAADVLGMRLRAPPRLAFLSACETGLINIDRRLDEFNGLLSAFLACGAGGAIGSLWPVSDAATSLLTAKFYDEHIMLRKSPSEALQAAQRWVRDSSAETFNDFVITKVATGKITPVEAASISAFLAEKRLGAALFRDPYYWGGFQLYGN